MRRADRAVAGDPLRPRARRAPRPAHRAGVRRHRYTPAEFGRPEPDRALGGVPRPASAGRCSTSSRPTTPASAPLVAKVFTPRAVAALRPLVEDVARSTLAPLLERSTFDMITDYAQPYSVEVICTWLGVPRRPTGSCCSTGRTRSSRCTSSTRPTTSGVAADTAGGRVHRLRRGADRREATRPGRRRSCRSSSPSRRRVRG